MPCSTPLRPRMLMMREGGDVVEEAEAAESGEVVDSWDDIAETPLEFDPEDPVCGPCADNDVVVDSDGEEFQAARGASTPKAPSREAQARHNLTHLPYASWCPWCIMGRRANAPHFKSKVALIAPFLYLWWTTLLSVTKTMLSSASFLWVSCSHRARCSLALLTPRVLWTLMEFRELLLSSASLDS